MNDKSEWIVVEVPELRIIDDELWAKVKKRQLEVEEAFSHTKTNRLNRSHRPKYLFSGLLECGYCGGSYSRAGEFKDRSEKLAFLERFRAILAEEEAEWRRLQVSVVAGAGFEPAAFRL